jgi:MarR-like DNA-binding transcriptional regulator SgrR of sgrS sRNA
MIMRYEQRVDVLYSREKVLSTIERLNATRRGKFTLDDIVTVSRISRRTVIRSLKDLESAKLLLIEPGRGRGGPNIYQLVTAGV